MDLLCTRYLCRNDQILLLPSKPLDGLAHDGLRFPAFVSLSGIEEIDSGIIRCFQALICSVYPVLSHQKRVWDVKGNNSYRLRRGHRM